MASGEKGAKLWGYCGLEGLVMTVKVPLDHELHVAIIRDAGRHLRPADLHMVYLLRQALNLAFPLPQANLASIASVASRGARVGREGGETGNDPKVT
jgi:hypothetical protein